MFRGFFFTPGSRGKGRGSRRSGFRGDVLRWGSFRGNFGNILHGGNFFPGRRLILRNRFFTGGRRLFFSGERFFLSGESFFFVRERLFFIGESFFFTGKNLIFKFRFGKIFRGFFPENTFFLRGFFFRVFFFPITGGNIIRRFFIVQGDFL
jgi:hypothetical protein